MEKSKQDALPEVDKDNALLLYANQIAPHLGEMTQKQQNETAVETARIRREQQAGDDSESLENLFVFVGRRVVDTIREQVDKHAA